MRFVEKALAGGGVVRRFCAKEVDQWVSHADVGERCIAQGHVLGGRLTDSANYLPAGCDDALGLAFGGSKITRLYSGHSHAARSPATTGLILGSFRVPKDKCGTRNILPHVRDQRDEAKRRQEALVISQDVTQAHWVPQIPVCTWRGYLGRTTCFDVGAIVGGPGEGGRVGLVGCECGDRWRREVGSGRRPGKRGKSQDVKPGRSWRILIGHSAVLGRGDPLGRGVVGDTPADVHPEACIAVEQRSLRHRLGVTVSAIQLLRGP